ncbi:MAG: 16S rRNA (cytosine(1402)-N(4))-methyltransferase, partial [Alphaproteobacteria bacterium]|nr:16S rRNA (cytosine(1402)-N(4))-methyltransferase [Alphaproteobacteria bacterium]
RAARRIARAIVAARAEKPIRTTGALADIVRAVLPRQAARTARTDPATRTFQALRIHVNGELDELDQGLVAAESLLKPGGRLAVVSFHSLEDRRVKTFLHERSGGAAPSRHLPSEADPRLPSFELLARRATKPGTQEIAANPRARSARLRAASRTRAPAWGELAA